MEDEVLLHTCIAAIEARLGWGSGYNWVQSDFEKLSDILQAETGVLLSVTTLKRVWGRVKYDSRPTLTTLNALAQFAGFGSWRAVRRNGDGIAAASAAAEMNGEAGGAVRPAEGPGRGMADGVAGMVARGAGRGRGVAAAWVFGALVIGVVLVFLNFNNGRRASVGAAPARDTTKYLFSLNKMVTNGVPNSVIFSYDASEAPSDSIYIVQTWDISRRVRVPKEGHHHSAMYYYPGYFHAKLMVDDRIVRTRDLQITTDGWLALAEGDPVPVYFKKEEYLKGDMVSVDEELLRKYNIPLLPHATRVRFFNQRDLGDLSDDNFTFETTLRNRFDQGDNACQHVQVLIQCKDDVIIIPLSAKSCVGELNLFASGASVDSRSADLSGFGCDLNQWVSLRVECADRRIRFLVNGVEAYHLTIPHAATEIVGVQYRFYGVGEVRGARFVGGGNEIKL